MSFYCSFGQLLKEREREVVLGFRHTPSTSVSSNESDGHRHELSAIAATSNFSGQPTAKSGEKSWMAANHGGPLVRAK
ncbi:hypothetical protein AAVH_11905 [Aphelenchoides avenae]|nr:hypothetical protein AAVH_28615 [Aphelenchus avenae]KAH7720574.1 hypothetical protein AAVH_11905 [Aphelenchus avenae]